jgi:hypothetical protein
MAGVIVVSPFMALLSFRGISTPSLPAQGEQRRSSYFNIDRDIPARRKLAAFVRSGSTPALAVIGVARPDLEVKRT